MPRGIEGKNCCNMKFDLSFWSTIRLGLFYLGMINLISPGAASSEVVYKTIDEDGVPLFSDKINGEHERVLIPKSKKTNVFESPLTKMIAIEKKEPKQIYKVEILSPPIDHTFRNSEKVSVRINVKPRLASGSGHEARVFLDGDLLSDFGSSMNFQVRDLERGAHTLEAVLTDIAGRELARSEVRTFFVQKASIVNRRRFNN